MSLLIAYYHLNRSTFDVEGVRHVLLNRIHYALCRMVEIVSHGFLTRATQTLLSLAQSKSLNLTKDQNERFQRVTFRVN